LKNKYAPQALASRVVYASVIYENGKKIVPHGVRAMQT
jgi:hypothetical protein